LLAKRLLTDTNLPVTEIAFASGFASLRRFNASFKERYAISPTVLRQDRSPKERHKSQDTITCEIAYRPPFDWECLLEFLTLRILPGVEIVEDGRYIRTAAFGKYRGWLAVGSPKNKPVLAIEVSASLAPVLLPILARAKRLFDVGAEPERIAAHLGGLSSRHPGLRVPGAFDGFELAVRAILGQQISVKAAATLAGRLTARYGDCIETPFENLTHTSPTASQIAHANKAALVRLGMTSARAQSVLALANAVLSRELVLEPGIFDRAMLDKLQALPGVGDWTSQYIAMRALCWPDAFPASDLGICKALKEKKREKILELAEQWRPWRSYAVMHLWKSLDKKIQED
jgi:AraC family transcriptional regulator of adaptative response / DNA-3-methyladenine glycosylase II